MARKALELVGFALGRNIRHIGRAERPIVFPQDVSANDKRLVGHRDHQRAREGLSMAITKATGAVATVGSPISGNTTTVGQTANRRICDLRW